jgi:radical SAM protein with 4Fe4S-binding SPASM domain
MPQGHFEQLIGQAVELRAKTIGVFGFGEPLMDKGIVDKVEYCFRRGLDTFITTNAGLLTDDLGARLLDAGLKHIRFSVHGLFAQDYHRVHKGLNFTKVLHQIHNFIRLNERRFVNRCKVSVTVIPMANESVDFIRDFWEYRVDWLEIWKPHSWGGAKDFRQPTKERKKTCGRAHRGPIQIQADGTVIPCCFLTNSELVLGDTYQNTIEEILKGDKYARLRNAHSTGNMAGLPCDSCDQLNIGDNPLLYSNRDERRTIGSTSSIKFNLEE